LEHKDRLDDWIEMCMKKEKTRDQPQVILTFVLILIFFFDSDSLKAPLVTVKKPSPASFKPLPKLSRLSRPAPHVSVKAQKPPLPSRNAPKVEGRGRNTLNSLSVPDPVFGSRLPAPNAVVKVPDPPTRSPSPPTLVVPQRRGNKFTTEDREFFINFLGWRLGQNPGLNRQELCEMLADKVFPIFFFG
jgi:hypothetical protein